MLSQVTKEEETCTPLLNPSNIFMDIVCHNGLDRGLPSLEKSVKLVAIFLVFHIELVFAIGCNVNF
jgi:hypothetical protein